MTVVAVPAQPTIDDLSPAVQALRAGEVVAIPTDTVYGVAVATSSAGATKKLFDVKRRPHGVDLPVLVASPSQARELVRDVSEGSARLMEVFWPGGLTLVMLRASHVDVDLGSNSGTIGLRCPDHPVPQLLAGAVGPIATTSANRHGEPTLTNAGDVVAVFGDEVSVVVDGGRSEGSPSTVVDVTGDVPKLLREGVIDFDAIRNVFG